MTGEKLVPMPRFPPQISSGIKRGSGYRPFYIFKVYFRLKTHFLLHRKHAVSLLQRFLCNWYCYIRKQSMFVLKILQKTWRLKILHDKMENFDVLLTAHLSIILVINQLNAQIFVL